MPDRLTDAAASASNSLTTGKMPNAPMLKGSSEEYLTVNKHIPVAGIDPSRRPIYVIDEIGSAFEVAAYVPSVG